MMEGNPSKVQKNFPSSELNPGARSGPDPDNLEAVESKRSRLDIMELLPLPVPAPAEVKVTESEVIEILEDVSSSEEEEEEQKPDLGSKSAVIVVGPIPVPDPPNVSSSVPNSTPPVNIKKETNTVKMKKSPDSKRANDVSVVDLASDSDDDIQVISKDKVPTKAKAATAARGSHGESDDDDDGDSSGLEFDACADTEIVLVQMKPLPLQELLDVIVPYRIMESPKTKDSDGQLGTHDLHFTLSTKTCGLIANEQAQVHVRFCVLKKDTASQELDDRLPTELELNINGVPAFPKMSTCVAKNPEKELEGMEKQSIDITDDIHWSSEKRNEVQVSWWHYPSAEAYHYAVGVSLWKPMTVDEVFENMKSTPPERTLKKIKDIIKAGSDTDVAAPDHIKVSLLCPVGRIRMEHPGCGMKCKHVQCFDVKSFLSMMFKSQKVSLKVPTMSCPVCKDKFELADLRLDQFFKNVLEKMSKKNLSSDEISIMANGKVKVIEK